MHEIVEYVTWIENLNHTLILDGFHIILNTFCYLKFKRIYISRVVLKRL